MDLLCAQLGRRVPEAGARAQFDKSSAILAAEGFEGIVCVHLLANTVNERTLIAYKKKQVP